MSYEFNAKLGALDFSFEWRLTLFTLILFPGLIALGFWQLDRAEEKAQLADRHARRLSLPPLEAGTLLALDRPEDVGPELADRRVSIDVAFEPNHYLLLDNRIRDGRYGYEVVALARLKDVSVPVNLGWLAGDPSRRELPPVTLPASLVTLTGRIYRPDSAPYLLGAVEPPQALPAVVQAVSFDALTGAVADLTGYGLLPIRVRIDQDHPAAFRADWPVVNQSPAKHTGYAVQWFTMSAALIIAFLLRSSNLGALVRGRVTKSSS